MATKNSKKIINIDNVVLDEYKSKHVIELVNLLVSAPASVLLLGQLCLLSFSVPDIEFTPFDNGAAKYLYSWWFRAGLQQVVAAGSDALCFAEEKLCEIEPQTRVILKGILDITNLTLQGRQVEVIKDLPKLIKDMANISGECMDMAKKVEARFEVMVELIDELSYAMTGAHSGLNFEEGKDTVAKIDGLMTGLVTLSKVKQQWQKLIEFFNFLFMIVENEMHGPLNEYMKSIKQTIDRKEREGKFSAFIRNKLQQQANKLATIATQVILVTTLYLEILQTHVVDHLVTLDSLQTITDAGKRAVKEKVMVEKCELAILEIAKQNNRRIDSAENDFKKILDTQYK